MLLAKTEGNPLFVEETIRMLLESGGDYLPERIPDTLQALIAARIDRLPPDEKALLHRASVIGRIFWHGAVEHIAPDLDVETVLDNLLLRDFVVPEARSTIVGERAYKLKHVLIREVAYAGPDESRAGPAARALRRVARRAGRGGAARDPGIPPRPRGAASGRARRRSRPELAREAAAALEEAGRRALAREANRSARKLLRARSSSSRRSSAATTPRERPGGSATCPRYPWRCSASSTVPVRPVTR